MGVNPKRKVELGREGSSGNPACLRDGCSGCLWGCGAASAGKPWRSLPWGCGPIICRWTWGAGWLHFWTKDPRNKRHPRQDRTEMPPLFSGNSSSR